MAALFKYFLSVAVIVPAVIVVAIFLGFAAVVETPTPGKELLGKPMAMAVRAPNTLHEAVTAKRIDMRQALQIHKLPRQIYAAGEEHQSYSQQSYGYADEPAFQPRRLIVFGHGIY